MLFSMRECTNMEQSDMKNYRIIYQSYDVKDPSKIITQKTLLEDNITAPTNCFDISMGLGKQIELVQTSQDAVIFEKIETLQQTKTGCSKCDGELIKFGNQYSTLYDVFTDHKVKIQRLKCNACGYESPSTIRRLINTTQSGDLKKIQTTLGANFTYRESEDILKLFSMSSRDINNHDRIKHVTEAVGNKIADINESEKDVLVAEEAKELILNVDGGHINTVEKQRSMEAMTSVIYRPEAIRSNSKDTRNYLTSKSCAASVRDDNQEQIISSTIIAGLKQGLSNKTHVTALCDGAANCWSVAESLRPLCKDMTCILDWFHLSMKIQNIALPEKLKTKLIRIKWHLWRGNTKNALSRLNELLETIKDDKNNKKIFKLINYIRNNQNKIINYRERKKSGLVFTSQLAESTVESLINRRCKGQQHMRWSREGLNPILQLRAAISSKTDWATKWKDAILNAA